MDYLASFAVSAAGMNVEKTRLDVAAGNIANSSVTRSGVGGLFRPKVAVVGSSVQTPFSSMLSRSAGAVEMPVVDAIREIESPPRLVHEPANPDADERGFVAYPALDPLREMTTTMTALRAYQANVAAMSAARSMAMRAMEIGVGK